MLRLPVCVLFLVVLTAAWARADGFDPSGPDQAQVDQGDQADQAGDSTAAGASRRPKTRRMWPDGWILLGGVMAALVLVGVLLGGSWRARRRDRQAGGRPKTGRAEIAARPESVEGPIRSPQDGRTMGLYISETQAVSSRQSTRQEQD
jgi:hypothetical protein